MVKAEAAAETERAELRAANRMLRQQVAALQAEIAQHKQEEEALRERAEYAQYLFEHANDAIVTLTLEGGVVTAVNRGLEVLLGWTREELVGQHYRKFVTAGEKVSSIYEVDFVRKDGRVVSVEARSRFIRNREGQPIGILAIHRDITARKETEEALRRSERELADFFEHAPIGLHWVGPEGTILRVNQAELDLLGYTREEYVGHHIAEFHADPPVIADILQRLTSQQTLNDYEARLRCKDGSLKTVLLSSNVLWEGERFIHTRCFTRDITERKHAEKALRDSEQRLRLMVEHLPAGAVYREGDVIFFNTAVEQITGYANADITSVDQWLNLLYGEEATTVRMRYEQDRAANSPHPRTMPVKRKDGQIRLVDFAGYRSESGEVWLLYDVTERAQAEAALRQAEQKYHTLVDRIHDGVFIFQDGKVQFANEAFANMVGYTVEEVTGMAFQELIAPEDVERLADRHRRRQAGEEVPWSYEFRLLHRDKTTRVIGDMNVTLVTYEGRAHSWG